MNKNNTFKGYLPLNFLYLFWNQLQIALNFIYFLLESNFFNIIVASRLNFVAERGIGYTLDFESVYDSSILTFV